MLGWAAPWHWYTLVGRTTVAWPSVPATFTRFLCFASLASLLCKNSEQAAGSSRVGPHWLTRLVIRASLTLAAVAVLSQGLLASAGPNWKAAATLYHRAQGLRAALRRHSNPSLAAYLRVIRVYQQVYRRDPGYRNAPLALAAAAEVYTEAGRSFADDRYYTKAIKTYRLLVTQYPDSRLAREALFTIAEIYRRDIENPEAARAAYRNYLQRYPQSAKAADAAVQVAHINDTLSEWAENRALRNRRTAPENAPLHTGPVAQVESIRHWLAPHYTRVVIQTGRQVGFQATHLQSPPRLIFDLDNTRLSPQLARKAFPVEHGFLRRIRVAQFKPKTTRVVLDVPQIENYSVFTLQNPFRLVIDVQGQRPRQSALALEASSGAPDLGPKAVPAPFVRQADTGTAGSDPTDSSIAGPPSSPDRSGVVDENSAGSSVGGEASVALPGSRDADLGEVAPTLTRALGLKIRRIVIDPGHGGHDTGTLGPAGIQEKNVVLDVALRLRRLILHRLGCQVVMTRSTDKFIALEERTAIANEGGADLFLSIHANASRDPEARGIETYYLNFTSDPEALAVAARENSTSEQSVFQLQNLVRKIALTEKIGESRDFAKIVDHQLTLHLDEDGDRQPDRGIKKAPFVVLIGANMPSILVEISFLSNAHDERLLRSPRFRQEIAQALYDGIARYVETLGTIRVAQRTLPQSLSHASRSF